MKQSKNEINLGEGSVGRLLLTLAVPSVIAQLVNLLYNLVIVFISVIFRKTGGWH